MSPTGCACCGTGCSCPGCGCCQCEGWESFFNVFAVGGNPGFYYLRPDLDLSLYDALERAGVCGLTRPYASQQDCVDAMNALYPGYPFDWTADGEPCGRWYSPFGPVGWSAPLISGQPATPALLNTLCPAGSPPPDPDGSGQTWFWGAAMFTGGGTPDIHKLVFKAGASTGDPIADAMFDNGTQPGIFGSTWYEASDCGSCDDPPAYEEDCTPGDDKRFYTKSVDWEFTNGDGVSCPDPEDPLGFCPPQNCKRVTITVTRTDKCGASDVVTEWKAMVIICPCLTLPFFGFDEGAGDLWDDAYGYRSEAECADDLGAEECNNNQWKHIRHETDEGRVEMPQTCCGYGQYGGYC